MTVALLVIGYPLMLMAFMLAMDRVEKPFRQEAVETDLERFLNTANDEEVQTFVSEGYSRALERYWKRRRGTRA